MKKRILLVCVGLLLVAVAIVLGTGLLADDGRPPPRGALVVPASIAADCSEDVGGELSRFINGVPDGSVVHFPENGCYAQANRIEVRDRTGVTIDGNGSSFKSKAPNDGRRVNPNWLIIRGRNVRIRNMRIVGNFHLDGERSQQRVNEASAGGAGNQFNMGVGVYGGVGVHVTDMAIEHVFGDGVASNIAYYVDGPKGQPLDVPRNVRVERVKVTKAARHCISPNQSDGFWLKDSELRDCWYGAFDAELDNPDQTLRDIHLLDNTFSDFNLFGIVIPVAGNGNSTRDIEIRGNRFLTHGDQVCNTIIEVGIYPTNPNMFKNVVVEDNSLEARGVGIAFDHVDGGRIRDNRIEHKPLNCYPTKTPMIRVKNSTGVKVEDNGG